jgi:glycosyltransferase involved in cell wall biosynthesis
MSGPEFSIATPTRNALDNLKRCVGSVRGQTGVKVQHIVHDACSTDGTAEWLGTQSRMHPNLQSTSEPDRGMYDAINKAWSKSSGRYLSWLNSDEQLLPGTLDRVKAFFEAHPTVSVVFGDYLVVDSAGRAIAARREIPFRRFYVANTFLYAQSCTLFYRRELLDRGLLKLDDQFRYAADKDLALRLSGAGVEFHHIPEILALFGVDGSNLSTHDGMRLEAEAVRLKHGGFKWKPLRMAASGGRRIERMVRGSYRARNLVYSFALDEIPRYVNYRVNGIGGRYSLTDTVGRGVEVSKASDAFNHKEF